MFLHFPQNKIFSPRKFESYSNSHLGFSPAIGQEFPRLTQQAIHLRQTDHLLGRSTDSLGSSGRVAVVFSGGPAPGGHNVVAALYDSLQQQNIELLGVIGGPKGLLEGQISPITLADRNRIINRGGFFLLGTDRTKINQPEQFDRVRTVCTQHNINGLIIIGGDDSNTNAAFLAEALVDDCICVVGVPKTIDGDLQIDQILPISFGFDTATKVYIETVESIICEARSSRKYWHFIKLMGRSASHITLEVALQTRPHIVLISEEIWSTRCTFLQIVQQMSQWIVSRFEKGFPYGVALIPEGIFERIDVTDPHLEQYLSRELLEEDSHGNLSLSRIESEKVLAQAVHRYLRENFPQVPFSFLCHFLGYEGRCAIPSVFDRGYAYLLGQVAANLYIQKCTGYLVCGGKLFAGGVPQAVCLPALFSQEMRRERCSWVIQKSLVQLDSPAFAMLQRHRFDNLFSDPDQWIGPRQYAQGAKTQIPVSVQLNQGYPEAISTILERFL